MSKESVTYGDAPTPIAINRIKFDINKINDSKTILKNEGLFFNFGTNTDQISTYYKMLIIGPKDTPYEDGFYLFSCQFPDQYPFFPMRVKICTQGGGVRIHPNLYTCGKCCFSFLGTWSGPPWTACQNPTSVGSSIDAQ